MGYLIHIYTTFGLTQLLDYTVQICKTVIIFVDVHQVEQIWVILWLLFFGLLLFLVQVYFSKFKFFVLNTLSFSCFFWISTNLSLSFRRTAVLQNHMIVIFTFIYTFDISWGSTLAIRQCSSLIRIWSGFIFASMSQRSFVMCYFNFFIWGLFIVLKARTLLIVDFSVTWIVIRIRNLAWGSLLWNFSFLRIRFKVH